MSLRVEPSPPFEELQRFAGAMTGARAGASEREAEEAEDELRARGGAGAVEQLAMLAATLEGVRAHSMRWPRFRGLHVSLFRPGLLSCSPDVLLRGRSLLLPLPLRRAELSTGGSLQPAASPVHG